MPFSEDVQSVISIVLFVMRILVPALSITILVGCFLSLKRGRRKEEPVVLLEDVASGISIPVLYWENSIGRSKSCDIVLPDNTVSRDHAVLMRREIGWNHHRHQLQGRYPAQRKANQRRYGCASWGHLFDWLLLPDAQTSQRRCASRKFQSLPCSEEGRQSQN